MGPVGKAAKTSLASAAFQDLVVVLEASGLASRFFRPEKADSYLLKKNLFFLANIGEA